MKKNILFLAGVSLSLFLVSCQENTSKSSANSKEDTNLPYNSKSFNGEIGDTYKNSESDFPQPVTPPEGAPNVLVILIDDLGFGGTEPFGGIIPTPNLDKLAANGLKYNRFHTTALCSPTRAALLSGRNHHQTGNGVISELSTGYPGYNSAWGPEQAAFPEVLKENGYSTVAIGKWHDASDWATSPLGPFDTWPTGKGFERFYGFIGGETDQYYPQLYRNIDPVEPKTTPEEGYILTPDLADETILNINQMTSLNPDKPWLVYFAPGAMHSPHQAPQEYIDRFTGKFDDGWDVFREKVHANQLAKGVIPPGTKLTERPKEMPAWESIKPEEKKVYARQMEVFAAMLAQLDENIGRILDAVEKTPNGDNTLVIAILGDNGCSPEGGLTGTINNMATQNGFPDDMQKMIEVNDELGGPGHGNNFSTVWAWAVDAPFQWTKEVASHLGGTRNGMIVSWPKKFKGTGEVRDQFYHVIDVAPTIYEAAGIQFPDKVYGVKQVPLAGTSMVPSFTNADAPETNTTQYFEMFGNRAIYHEGWIAAARDGLPWVLLGREGDFDSNTWELYNLNEDFSQANDLAASNPDKLKELQALFDKEAKKYNVYPLDDRFTERGNVPDRPSITRGKTSFTYYPGSTRIPEGSAPNVKSVSHTINAVIEVPENGKVQGVIVAAGGDAGYSLFVKDGYLMYENNFFGRNRDVLKSKSRLPKGKNTVTFEYTQVSKEWGGGGPAKILINGKEEDSMTFENVATVRYSATETFDIGIDLGMPVSTQYHTNFPFTGKIDHVKIDIMPQPKTAANEAKTKEATKNITASIE